MNTFVLHHAYVPLTHNDYKIMSAGLDIHWFCKNCEAKSLESVLTEKEIEQKIAYHRI